MTQAIWTLLYRISEADRDRYLDWFHDVHVPDKLARPGYTWAAHYEQPLADGAAERGYVACFGGTTTRVFYDPSPAQLKGRQDALTREMMGYRIGNVGMVYIEEWRQAAGAERGQAALTAPVIRLACLDAGGADEGLEAWLAQSEAARVSAAAGAIGFRKWLSASAGPRHAVVHEFQSVQAIEAAAGSGAPPPSPDGPPAGSISEPYGPARVALRLHPEP